MSTTEPKRRGRRPNGTDTKEALLTAARQVFAEQGYDAATVRAIAGGAGVDPAMVKHWFGGKEGLFTAAVQIPINPAEILRDEADDPERAPRQIVFEPELVVRESTTPGVSAG